MGNRNTVMLAGATLVGIAILAGWPRPRHADPAPQAAAEPDLFPFLTPAADAPTQVEVRRDIAAVAVETPSAPARLAAAQKAAQSLRAQGATEDEVYRMRAAALPAGDADRLAALDRAEAAWQARVRAYLVEAGNLPADSSGANRQRALQQLRDARFSPEEQARLAAYEPHRVPQLTMDQ